MRNISLLLAVLAVIALGAVAWRYMNGGPPGPKTWAVAVLGIILAVAAFLVRRRPVVTTTTTTGTRGV